MLVLQMIDLITLLFTPGGAQLEIKKKNKKQLPPTISAELASSLPLVKARALLCPPPPHPG